MAIRTRTLFLALALLLTSLPAWSWTNWKPIGPMGGYIDQLVPDANQPLVWYAVNTGAVYRSSDGGNSWTRMFDQGYGVSINPKTSEALVYAAGGIYSVSKDSKNVRLLIKKKGFRRVAWDNQGANYAYLLTDNELYQSKDGGKTWKRRNYFQQDDGYDCWSQNLDLAVSPFDRNTVYTTEETECEYYSYHALLVSRDGGKSWEDAGYSAPRAYYGLNLAVDPANTSRVYAYNCDSIGQLTSSGWQVVKRTGARLLAPVPGEPEHLLAVSCTSGARRIMESKDNGRSWNIAEQTQQQVIQVAAGSDNTLLVGTQNSGVYKRVSPRHWRQVNTGFKPAAISMITRSPRSKIVYAAPRSGTLFRMDESKNFWQARFPGLVLRDGEWGPQIAVDPGNGNHLFASTGPRVEVSFNGGQSWKAANGAPSCWSVPLFAFDGTSNPQRVFFACSKVLYRSEDAGRNFEAVHIFDHDVNGFSVDPNDGRLLYAFSFAGIMRSVDYGASFQRIDGPGTVTLIAGANLGKPDSFMVIDDQLRVSRTFDGGHHWEQVASLGEWQWWWMTPEILPADSSGSHIFIFRPVSYSRFNRPTLLESKDGGLTWADVTAELGSKTTVFDLTDPRFPPIYLATNRGVLMQK